jgi:type IV secretory pathway TrbD component
VLGVLIWAIAAGKPAEEAKDSLFHILLVLLVVCDQGEFERVLHRVLQLPFVQLLCEAVFGILIWDIASSTAVRLPRAGTLRRKSEGCRTAALLRW